MRLQSYRPRSGTWVALLALLVFSFPFTLAALQHQPAPPVTPSTVDQPSARVEGETTKGEVQEIREKPTAPPDPCATAGTVAAAASGPRQTEVIYKLGHLLNDPDDYLGKTITVDGEMHRQFTEKVFTIEDDGFLRDRDMLVISISPMSESVIPLQNSFDRGKNVRVTGVLRPYDRDKLECLFGPLNLESREGHSFTKNPVLIIGYKEPPKQSAIMPPPLLEKPTFSLPAPEPAAAPEPPAPKEETAVVQTPTAPALPKTASNVPLIGLTGAVLLLAVCSKRFFTRCLVRDK